MDCAIEEEDTLDARTPASPLPVPGRLGRVARRERARRLSLRLWAAGVSVPLDPGVPALRREHAAAALYLLTSVALVALLAGVAAAWALA